MKYFLIFVKDNDAVIKEFKSYGDRLEWLSKNNSSLMNLMLFEADSLRQEMEDASTRLDTKNIDLGDLGSLMAPVKVGDKTYMVLSTTKGEKHTWDDYISMKKIQAKFFGGEKVTEENSTCEINGHRLKLPTKNELLAIHRQFDGAPPGWVNHHYWSATPSGSGHAFVLLVTGNVNDNRDDNNSYVAFEVL